MRYNLSAAAEELRIAASLDADATATLQTCVNDQRAARLKMGELWATCPVELQPDLAGRANVSRDRLVSYARVWRAWPPEHIPADISFTVLEELTAHPDRFALVGTGEITSKRDARQAKGGAHPDQPRRPTDWDVDRQVAAAEAMLTNPVVRNRVYRNIADDLAERNARVRREHADPAPGHGLTVLGALADFQKARERLQAVLKTVRGADLTDFDRAALNEANRKIAALSAFLDTAISGEVSVDWDRELTRLTEG